MSWQVTLAQSDRQRFRHASRFADATQTIEVDHCATVEQACRTAQRAYPGWTVVMVEAI